MVDFVYLKMQRFLVCDCQINIRFSQPLQFHLFSLVWKLCFGSAQRTTFQGYVWIVNITELRRGRILLVVWYGLKRAEYTVNGSTYI